MAHGSFCAANISAFRLHKIFKEWCHACAEIENPGHPQTQNRYKRKSGLRGIRTHAAQKEGCAERIAPIGTLSQNGYGEHMGTHKRTMGAPDVVREIFEAGVASAIRLGSGYFPVMKIRKIEKMTPPGFEPTRRKRRAAQSASPRLVP